MLVHMLLRVREWAANRSMLGKVRSISGSTERAHTVPVLFGAWQRALAACMGAHEAKFSSGRRKRLHGMPLENGIPKEVSQGRLLRVTVPRGSRF
jgi:hypothetical protein